MLRQLHKLEIKMKNILSVLLIVFLISCAKESNKIQNIKLEDNKVETETSLKSKLSAKKEAFDMKAPEEKKIAYEDGIKAVKESGVLDRAINKGNKAPDFKLKNANGDTIALYERLSSGPIVLTWYRGGWCPYCNMQLAYYQEHLNEFKEAGAELIAITPELPDNSLSTKEKNKLEFEVLSDVNNKVAEEYKIMFDLTEEVEKYYKQSFSFKDYYGNEEGRLPLAVTYVIAQNGTVTYAFIDPDYRNRAELKDILDALNKL